MRVYWRLEDVPSDFGPSALTIGNFDGVHAGHEELMRRAASLGRAKHWKPSVLTFNPHPARVVAPARAPRMITSFERRVELMGEAGIEQVVVLPFTQEVARWSAEFFVRDLLVRRLGAKVVVVGDDFRFGHKQSGNRELLERLGLELGFRMELVEPVSVRGARVSSSLVRQVAAEGNVTRAARLLKRPFELQGSIVSGQGIGSKQTVPTLNLAADAEVLPANGVYVTRAFDLDRARDWNSITNVGYRPTFDGESITVETFLLGEFEEPTPRRIRLQFLRRIRDERKFEWPAELRAQILRDVAFANRVHARLARFRRVP